ncbi:TRAP transporter large permease subunit [Oceanispirochaeta crateris]|uniref:TRAP transporter large permease subunit n=1 Tax=Oceanispirochaeta crateris TaxID=2518645 RepID=A0A5C1QQX1_9SPIO|nr:TRAP transporter large permease subunit [Oceanispirochaeta crateris]QEN09360.1 TRAP transporter large permease subunit [Oceanispirochaeta crateris]
MRLISRVLNKIEFRVASLVFLILAFVPVLEILTRLFFNNGIKGAESYVSHAVIWVAFLAGMIASKEKAHLSLTSGRDLFKGSLAVFSTSLSRILSGGICFGLTFSALSFILIGFDPTQMVGLIPIRFVALIIPLGFMVMGLRFFYIDEKKMVTTPIILITILLGLFLGIPSMTNMLYSLLPDPPLFIDSLSMLYYDFFHYAAYPMIFLLLLSTISGTPIFILLGGLAFFLFSRDWGSLEIIPNEAYNLLTSSSVPAIPLFTLTGFILSESKAGERLVRLFKSLFGGLPGGMAVMAVVVSAFFTTFTGASGVTILAMGGLLSYMLHESGDYKEGFIKGLLTSSGSIGLLFPPSLPIIMYAVMAQISVKDMFLGGLIPGLILVLSLATMGIVASFHKKRNSSFNGSEILPALKDATGEIFLPVLILSGYFGGFFTLVETGAVSVVYSLLLEGLIHRDIKRSDLSRIMQKSLPIIGGILMILAVSKGLSYYLIDAEVPQALTSFVRNSISSKLVFLIILNIILLLTGCLMDIYSAILVVGPLVIPMGELFGIHPVQLGIIFLANLQLGYLTPPVGMNLFLASYRFETPLVEIYKKVFPFLMVLLVMVLLITYVPWFSLAFLGIQG